MKSPSEYVAGLKPRSHYYAAWMEPNGSIIPVDFHNQIGDYPTQFKAGRIRLVVEYHDSQATRSLGVEFRPPCVLTPAQGVILTLLQQHMGAFIGRIDTTEGYETFKERSRFAARLHSLNRTLVKVGV